MKNNNIKRFSLKIAGISLLMSSSMALNASGVVLPKTLVWTTYDTGSAGFNQAVAIGSVFQKEYDIRLRVIPGRNDIGRLSPVRSGRANFAADGSPSTYAQEGLFDFGAKEWGPQPIRLAMWSISDSCSVTMVAAADSGIKNLSDLRGQKVAYVQAAAGLNNAISAFLAYENMTWKDVEQVEVGSWSAALDAVLNGNADVLAASCNTSQLVRLESSPRGLHFLPVSTDNKEGIGRALSFMPWYLPSIAIEGVGLSKDNPLDVLHAPYPQLTTYEDQSEDIVYNTVKALDLHYDDYKDNGPGLYGWELARQKVEDAFMPYHPGAIRYYKEVGVWTEAAEQNQKRNLNRQEVLGKAWQEYVKNASSDDEAFIKGWMEARKAALESKGMITILDSW